MSVFVDYSFGGFEPDFYVELNGENYIEIDGEKYNIKNKDVVPFVYGENGEQIVAWKDFVEDFLEALKRKKNEQNRI